MSIGLARRRNAVRDLRHRVLMVQPFLGRLERGGQVQDRLPALQRDDPAVREALALEVAHDPVDDRVLLVARAHEVSVERVGFLALRRPLRSLQRLRDHLTAEHPAPSPGQPRATVEVGVDLLHIEQADEVGRKLVRGRRGPVVGHSLSFVPAAGAAQ